MPLGMALRMAETTETSAAMHSTKVNYIYMQKLQLGVFKMRTEGPQI